LDCEGKFAALQAAAFCDAGGVPRRWTVPVVGFFATGCRLQGQAAVPQPGKMSFTAGHETDSV